MEEAPDQVIPKAGRVPQSVRKASLSQVVSSICDSPCKKIGAFVGARFSPIDEPWPEFVWVASYVVWQIFFLLRS